MGVTGMGTTFIQTVIFQTLNIEAGGEANYTIKVDKQDSADSIYMHITGKDGSTVKFAGTDVLSAQGLILDMRRIQVVLILLIVLLLLL